MAPLPSMQNIPAPMPPMGNATRSRFRPVYGPLNCRGGISAADTDDIQSTANASIPRTARLQAFRVIMA